MANGEVAVKARVEQIRNKITETDPRYDKEKLQENACQPPSWIVAVVKVGAGHRNRDLEATRSLRLEDPFNATQAGCEEGIVSKEAAHHPCFQNLAPGPGRGGRLANLSE